MIVGADLTGDSGLAVRATFCFGSGRASAHHHQSLVMPKVAGPDQCPSYFEWLQRPNFMSHFEGQLAHGAHPRTNGRLTRFDFSGAQVKLSGKKWRFREVWYMASE